ncbi:hypothetical protein JCM5296_001828 [Sporobolomyces johnsonii]
MLASTFLFFFHASFALVAHTSPITPVRRLYPPPPGAFGSSSGSLQRRAVAGPGPFATYIVVLADGVNLASHLAWLTEGIAANGGPASPYPANAPLPAPAGGSPDSGTGGSPSGSDTGAGGSAGGDTGAGGSAGGDTSGGGGSAPTDGSGGSAPTDGSGAPASGGDTAMSGPWDGETGTTDGDGCGVSWSDAGMGMYVAVLQGVIYDAVVASPNVDSVATDDDGQIAGGPMPGSNAPAKTFIQAQANAPWNIARISSRKAVSTNPTYYYNSTAGQGVDLLDTGVLVTHTQFSQRAKVAANIGLGTADGNGHGTFCASVAIGTTYGVAKKANIYSIKVMTDSGGGTASNVVKGVAATLKLVAKSKRPSIISLSASFPANSALDAAAKKAFTKGIHFVSAAGNAGADASSYSPARSPYSVTVGAIDASDTIAKFSNTGQVVSLFAGGVNVLGAYIGNTGASATLSGTSMATPAVAGVIAYYISVWQAAILVFRFLAFSD